MGNHIAQINGEKVEIISGRITDNGHLLTAKNLETKEGHETLVGNFTYESKKSADLICLHFFKRSVDEILEADKEALKIDFELKRHEAIPHYALALG